MQQEQYKVHLESFEGPLDLLLHLIEKNRIDIYDIPIALLTEQYMDYLAKFKKFNIEVASEFFSHGSYIITNQIQNFIT